MKIEMLALDDLKPYKLNAKVHPESQISGIAESIRRFGFTQPIVIDKKKNVIIGHARIDAAKKTKLKKVPCLILSDLTAVEVRALRLIDNKIAETSWDVEKLSQEFENLEFDFSVFNVSFQEFSLTNGDEVTDVAGEWDGMPDFKNDVDAYRSIVVHFKDEKAVKAFQRLIGQEFTEKTKFIHYPFKARDVNKDKTWEADEEQK